MSNVTICYNLKINGLTQYTNFDFNSMCRFNGQTLAASDGGLFVIDSGDDDDGTDIDAYFELPRSDFGSAYQKRIRSGYAGYESSGTLNIKLATDEGTAVTLPLSPTRSGQHGGRFPGRRDTKGRYHTIRVENVDGCDFSIDRIDIIPVILNRKPSGS